MSAGDSVEEEERYNINLKLFCDSVLHKLYIFFIIIYIYIIFIARCLLLVDIFST